MNTAENRDGAAPETTPSVPVVTVEAPDGPMQLEILDIRRAD